MERLALQVCVALAALAPVAGGMDGAIWGPAALGQPMHGAADSHFRFLSGLLAAIGISYWTTVPEIERAGGRFLLLTLIVVAGGCVRAFGMVVVGPAGPLMSAALVMELVVAPALFLWQSRIQRIAERRPATLTAVDAAEG